MIKIFGEGNPDWAEGLRPFEAEDGIGSSFFIKRSSNIKTIAGYSDNPNPNPNPNPSPNPNPNPKPKPNPNPNPNPTPTPTPTPNPNQATPTPRTRAGS